MPDSRTTPEHSPAAAAAKPAASLSIDLDNLWAYMRTAGLPGWQDYPSYFEAAVPRIRDCLDRSGVRLTVFVVGRDAARSENRAQLAGLASDGHEIASHSFEHESWLSRRSREVIAADIARAEAAIERATGQRPVGFRGPSFGLSSHLLDVLMERGYLYDASTFPTLIGPLARAYYNLRSGGSAEDRRARNLLFGSLADGLRPLAPYAWQSGTRRLVEIPVTTFPGLRTPIHLTYLIFLAGFSPALARTYLRTALRACRAAGIAPSLLLHPLEFLGVEDAPALRFFPGLNVPLDVKLGVVEHALRMLAEQFRVLTLSDHAALALAGGPLPTRRPRFEADTAVLEPAPT